MAIAEASDDQPLSQDSLLALANKVNHRRRPETSQCALPRNVGHDTIREIINYTRAA